MKGVHSNSFEMEKNSPTPNNPTIINKESVDVAEIPIKLINEENLVNDSKLSPDGKNERKIAEFKVSYNDAEKMNKNYYDRKIEHGSERVFSNNRYTTPVTFKFFPEKNSPYLNIFSSHKKVFIAMKIADASTKLITNDGSVFDSPAELLEGSDYVTHFPATNKIQFQRKVFISCKVELSLRLSQI